MIQEKKIQEDKLHAFVGQVLNDLGGAFSIGLVQIGANLGIYKAMHERGPVTAPELARHTGLAERYLREWLAHQAASGYVTYEAATRKFALPAEHALVFAMPDSPVYLVDAFNSAARSLGNRPMVEAAFKTGEGVPRGVTRTGACSARSPASSAPATTTTLSGSGCRRWTV
jgi:hypothetical protein